MKWPRLKSVLRVVAAVNSSGAVSPAARALASRMPVTIPGTAVRSKIRRKTFQRGPPSASAASRAPRFAQRAGDQEQDHIARADHDRQHQQRQRQRALVAGVGAAGADDEADVDEQAEDDRRHAGPHVDEEAHDLRDPTLATVLDEPHGYADPDRDRYHRG